MNPNHIFDLTIEEFTSFDTYVMSRKALERMYSYIMQHSTAVNHFEDFLLPNYYMMRLHDEVERLQSENERLKNRTFIGRIKKMIRK